MLRRVFGRKGATPTPAAAPEPTPASALDPSDDRPYWNRFLDSLGTQVNRPINSVVWHADSPVKRAVASLSLSDRSALLCSLEPLLGPREDISIRDRIEMKELFDCLTYSDDPPVTHGTVDFLTRALVAPDVDWIHETFTLERVHRFLKTAKDQGHPFNSDERERIASYARRLEGKQFDAYSKGQQDRSASLVKLFYALADISSDDREINAARIDQWCDHQPSPLRFRPLPYHARFWSDFLALVSDKAEALKSEIAKKPVWLKDEAAFNDRFRSVGGVPLDFGFWTRDALKDWRGDGRNFKAMKKPEEDNPRERLLAHLPHDELVAERTRLATLADLEWHRAYIPGADILLGKRSEAEEDLFLMLVESKAQPKAPAKWRKDALKLIHQIGRPKMMDRFERWLALFARPALDETSIGQLHDCHQRALHIALFDRLFPDWKALPDEDLDALADWVALTSIGNHSDGPCSIYGFLNSYNRLVPDPARIEIIQQGATYPKTDAERYDIGNRYRRPFAFPSTPTENALRAVTWLLAEDAANVPLLEDVAIAATALKNSDRLRSKMVANAAIASLGTIGTPEALQALGRLRRTIANKAIGNAVQKAMDKLAAKHGVQPDDIAEQSLPDYGFD
ncbi:hypothetical protein [Sphingomicrobium arenosum]|uniref:hypothetical protein n=1 Tax=Sphingomicrobium arenosum TaxID=2233861 RepID=UPI002240D19F|nr:hypothetical protein [Sphingomicrobium arenosum]